MRIALLALLAACGSDKPAPFRVSTLCHEIEIAAMSWKSNLTGIAKPPPSSCGPGDANCALMTATFDCFSFTRAAARMQGEIHAYERARLAEIPKPLFEKVNDFYIKVAAALDEVGNGADLCQENFKRRDFPIHESDKFEPQRWVDEGVKQALAALPKVDAAIAECNAIK